MITPSFPVPCYGEINGEINGELGNFYEDYVKYCKIAFLDFRIAHLNSLHPTPINFCRDYDVYHKVTLFFEFGFRIWMQSLLQKVTVLYGYHFFLTGCDFLFLTVM